MGGERQIGSTSALARSLLDLCRSRRLTLATAESCTGGLVAGALTDIPGSSDVVDRGFVTYSNEAKRAMLGVNATTLATFGAVSKETATQMAVGALERAGVDLAVSTTGIAGPGGATPGKPVGLVHFAAAARRAHTAPSCGETETAAAGVRTQGRSRCATDASPCRCRRTICVPVGELDQGERLIVPRACGAP